MSPKLNTLPSQMLNTLIKSLLLSGLLIYLVYVFSFDDSWLYASLPTKTIRLRPRPRPRPHPLNASDIVFGIAATAKSWKSRKHYVESWWRPNATRGYVFFERLHPDLLPWRNETLPALRIYRDASAYKDYNRHKARQAIKMARIISEMVEMEQEAGGGARWYFLCDDDTLILVDNLVEVLGKYDHDKYMYVGMNSETHGSNILFSFDMAFGGAGYALSRPLAEAVAANMDVCLKRYPTLYGSDHIVQACVADLGVSITKDPGFHQIDLHFDLSGFLSSHPRAPLVSLHHLEQALPIFPSKSHNGSLRHLMTAAKADESRLLQQVVCYDEAKNWTFSVAWGYAVQLYESVVLPSALQRPLQTFWPWTKFGVPFFAFNTRPLSKHPCHAPHHFFLSSAVRNGTGDGYVVTRYGRGGPRRGSAVCEYTGNHSALSVSTVVVHSPAAKYTVVGNRRECCDVVSHGMRMDDAVVEIKVRDCFENEIIPSTVY